MRRSATSDPPPQIVQMRVVVAWLPEALPGSAQGGDTAASRSQVNPSVGPCRAECVVGECTERPQATRHALCQKPRRVWLGSDGEQTCAHVRADVDCRAHRQPRNHVHVPARGRVRKGLRRQNKGHGSGAATSHVLAAAATGIPGRSVYEVMAYFPYVLKAARFLAAAPGYARPQAAVLARRQHKRQDDGACGRRPTRRRRRGRAGSGSCGSRVSQGDRCAAG